MPFLAVTAAIGLHDWLRAIADATGAARRRRTCALVLVLVVIGAALFELGGFHFRRSESAVRLAREIASRDELAGATLVVEQAWRWGGRLYFPRGTRVVDLPPERAGTPALAGMACQPGVVLVAVRSVAPADVAAAIGSCGYTSRAVATVSDYTVFARATGP